MSVAHLARSQSKKIMNIGLSIFNPTFNSSKCKTWAKMTTSRIKLLRNKREALVKQMRRDVALLLESGQDATARIRVEHVIREQNTMAANEIIELFCEHIVARLPIISKQRDCPPDLKEAISSLIFAASRCSDVPELLSIRDIFQKKYGRDFVSAASDLRPESGVSRLLIEKLSARSPTAEVKLKVMKEIAKEYKVEWDTMETQQELLNPLDDPKEEALKAFVTAPTLPMSSKPTSVGSKVASARLSDESEMYYEDAASAARAAAQLAKEAIAAAEAAAKLANTTGTNKKGFYQRMVEEEEEKEEEEEEEEDNETSYYKNWRQGSNHGY